MMFEFSDHVVQLCVCRANEESCRKLGGRATKRGAQGRVLISELGVVRDARGLEMKLENKTR